MDASVAQGVRGEWCGMKLRQRIDDALPYLGMLVFVGAIIAGRVLQAYGEEGWAALLIFGIVMPMWIYMAIITQGMYRR